MKKLTYLILFLAAISISAAPTRQNVYTSGVTIRSNDVTENEDEIFGYLQTGVDTLRTDALDTITEIKSTLKSGSDATVVTGTKGTSGYCAEWDANGDLVEAASGAACGTGGSNTAWDDLGNPDNNTRTTVTFDNAAEATTFSTAYDTAGSFMIIDNTDTILANANYLLELQHSADGDAEGDFFKCVDNNSDVKFQIDDGGTTTLAGDIKGSSCPIKTAAYTSEENGGLATGYYFAFGNGSEGGDSGIVAPCDGKLVMFAVNCEDQATTTSTLEVRIDNSGTNCETDVDTAGGAGNFYGSDVACSDTFTAGQLLNVYVIDDAGTCAYCQATFYVQFD